MEILLLTSFTSLSIAFKTRLAQTFISRGRVSAYSIHATFASTLAAFWWSRTFGIWKAAALQCIAIALKREVRKVWH